MKIYKIIIIERLYINWYCIVNIKYNILQNIAIKNNKRLDFDAINRLIIRLIKIENLTNSNI